MSDPTEDWYAHDPDPSANYSYSFLRHVVYADDRWVAVGRGSFPSGGGFASDSLVVVSQTPDGPWEAVNAAASSGLYGPELYRVAWGGGKWVAIGDAPYDKYGVSIFTATDPIGEWTYNSALVSNTPLGYVFAPSLAFDGTTWAVLSQSGKLYVATNPAGSWSLERDFGSEVTLPGYNVFSRLDYVNGKWLLGHSALESGEWKVKTYSASSPTGTWTSRGTFAGYAGPIGYGPDGYFMLSGGQYVFTNPLTGTAWTNRINLLDEIPEGSQTGIYYDSIYDLRYDDGVFVAVAYRDEDRGMLFLTASSIEGPWKAFVVPDEQRSSAASVASDGEDWAAVGATTVGFSTLKARVWNPDSAGAGWGLTL